MSKIGDLGFGSSVEYDVERFDLRKRDILLNFMLIPRWPSKLGQIRLFSDSWRRRISVAWISIQQMCTCSLYTLTFIKQIYEIHVVAQSSGAHNQKHVCNLLYDTYTNYSIILVYANSDLIFAILSVDNNVALIKLWNMAALIKSLVEQEVVIQQ